MPDVELNPTEELGLRPRTTDVILGVLKSQGVPPSAIQLIGHSVTSTRDEAAAVADWLAARTAGPLTTGPPGGDLRKS